ncbi:MAG TPA: SMP-30/gluconolactonase/LRE family protein [Solirubrobacteraceae bacterium]|jgi:tripartite motif-containing protein 71|nr:SMP-30/gluconolactonase/LRE family protein [Solirubrobacteraceae bacterium]
MRLRSPSPATPGIALGTGISATREFAGLVLLSLVCLLTTSWLVPTDARAEACPGASFCPYSSVRQIGQRGEGVLRFPEAVAIGPAGDIYVADQLGYTVQEFSPAGAFENQWGSFGGGHGQFGPVGGLAVDPAGNVYLVDSAHNRIEKFTATGTFIKAWGRHGGEIGQFSFGSSQDPTQPPGGGIAVTASYVYVADSGNDRIERFNLEGGEAMAWGTKGSEPGQFLYPRGIAANGAEVLVADDDNHRVEMFNPEGAYVASAGSQGKGPGQFGFPYGLALDAAGNAYVADDINHRVVKLSAQLGFLGAWGGFGSGPGQLAYPRAIASNGAGENYVADTANGRIEVFDANGDFERTIGTDARGPWGQMTAPKGLAVDPTGRLIVSDTDASRVELFAPASDAFSGQWTAMPGREPLLNRPSGVGVDPAGSVYIGDAQGNERAVRMWGDGTPLSELGGPAQVGGATLAGTTSFAVSAQSHDLYVADAGHNRVLVYGREGKLLARWGAESGNVSFGHPQALAVDRAGDVDVADTGHDRVVRLNPSGNVIGEWGSAGSAAGRFDAPNGIGVDAAGTVFVLDGENNRVQAFTETGGYLYRWGNRGTGPGQLSQPGALAVGCEGNVYVADTNNNRVERFEMGNRAGVGCVPASAWPPPLDVPPVLSVKLLRSSGVLAQRALTVALSCQRGCKVLVTATLAPSSRRARAVRLVGVARGLPAARTGHLRLRVSRAGLARLRAALGRRRGLRASIRILAVGPTGRRTTVQRSYLVTR